MNFTFPFCLFQRKEGFEEQFFFFFNTSKASITHNWNFHLILCIFTENSLCSMDTEGNKPISNYSYSLWGGSCPSQLSPLLLWPQWGYSRVPIQAQFGTISMHKVGAIYSLFSWVMGSWRKYNGARIWGHEKPNSILPLLCPSNHAWLGKQEIDFTHSLWWLSKAWVCFFLLHFYKRKWNVRTIFIECKTHDIATLYFLGRAFCFSSLIKKCIIQVISKSVSSCSVAVLLRLLICQQNILTKFWF